MISAENVTEDRLMEVVLECGAEDVKTEEEYFEVLCSVADYDTVAKALDDAGIKTESSELAYIPNNYIEITDEDTARKILKMFERLDDLEDVKKLAALQIHGAIIGKAYYTGAINLRDAIEVAK